MYWFCQISKWIHHRYTCVPHPEPSSLLPPHSIPLGRPSAPAPSIQYLASNLDWRLVSYILYMFQCHSPKFFKKDIILVIWTLKYNISKIIILQTFSYAHILAMFVCKTISPALLKKDPFKNMVPFCFVFT